MIYENTGFYLDNNMKLREAARSIDTESRAAGIEALKPLVAGFGPDSADQNRIVKRFLQERDNESLIFTCGVCGVSNHESIAVTQVGEYWIDCKLRLTPQEVTGYKQSRVEGYTNITVLAEYALANAQSLHWAFHNLYEKEGATDKLFKDLCLASNVDNQIILFLVPQLINFSNHPHEKDNYENIGIMGICSSCNQELANNSRPEFSMCGKFQCNFGYPKYLDGLNINDLSVAELLAVSQARLYAHLVKCIKGSSVTPNTRLKGHVITFLQDSLADQIKESETYPRTDLSSMLSIMLIGSKDDKDLSSKNGRDLIKNGICKGILKIRPFQINIFVQGLITHNLLFQDCQYKALTEAENVMLQCKKTVPTLNDTLSNSKHQKD